MVEIVTQVATKQLPRDAAVAIMQRAFQVDEAQANKLLGTAGKGFTPAASP